MWFLFLQIWVWLLIAFLLGWFAHWFFCCRGESKEGKETKISATMPLVSDASVQPTTDLSNAEAGEDMKPILFASAPEKTDDLKKIKGVGLVLEQTLHDLGVYHYSQIADWTDEHVAWMDNSLSFTGRIDREDWRGQARTLAAGGTTDFSKQVEDGDVDY